MSIAQNLQRIKSVLPANITLIAVSKFHPVSALREAYNAGQRIFGESRVQELMTKQPLLPADIEWHFIGTLQRNKVKYIAPFIHTIQSMDTLELLQEVNKYAAINNRVIRVLLEVHIAKESSKHGFSMDECFSLFEQKHPATFPSVNICGLMGMATFTDNSEQVTQEFRSLCDLFNEIKCSGYADNCFTELSMGMSDDYRLAIQNGSTMVRMGTSIFGQREY
ncbi:MAG: YggS family pyridoxal phosphate-dependent enzyme [Tannerella sp.]|jgi:pyridoxal phosphate enzyme (YggS family)|nr:YggS family pyridoxal phosphate-dependent enzyme [Tannerella sp.]